MGVGLLDLVAVKVKTFASILIKVNRSQDSRSFMRPHQGKILSIYFDICLTQPLSKWGVTVDAEKWQPYFELPNDGQHYSNYRFGGPMK